MGLFGSSDSGDTGFASKLRTSTGSKDLDLSYGNDSLGGQGFNDSAGDMNAQEFANTLQMQGQMAQLFSKVSHDTLLLDRRSIDLSGAREKEGHFHCKNF